MVLCSNNGCFDHRGPGELAGWVQLGFQGHICSVFWQPCCGSEVNRLLQLWLGCCAGAAGKETFRMRCSAALPQMLASHTRMHVTPECMCLHVLTRRGAAAGACAAGGFSSQQGCMLLHMSCLPMFWSLLLQHIQHNYMCSIASALWFVVLCVMPAAAVFVNFAMVQHVPCFALGAAAQICARQVSRVALISKALSATSWWFGSVGWCHCLKLPLLYMLAALVPFQVPFIKHC
ncbi:hypothetical protein COO60DRAFT_1520442 [Scenedesmus sp. NREL 46B-D3]|nr:hypothetical protein COO60DRAFT_1520442 [Scenedesmus sp. NREL 46B-D3]